MNSVLLGVSLKLYLDIEATTRWATELADLAQRTPAVQDGRVKLFALPSLPALPAVTRALAGTPVGFGAQDLHWADRGAFTGAVSGADLAQAGCQYVEVGHAERRGIFGETDDVVAAKFAAALRNGITPVLCVGESRQGDGVAASDQAGAQAGDQAGEAAVAQAAAAECVRQLESAMGDDPAAWEGASVVVAYEPVWAIGQAHPAPAVHIRAVTRALKARLAAEAGLASAAVIYGGSAQRGTLSALSEAVDGLFLGRFAHDTAELDAIIAEAAVG